MKGLIKKDLLLIKNNLKLMIILLFFFIVISFSSDNISFILPLISVMMMLSTFSYDQYNKWDTYVSAIPNGRQNSVKSKYVVTLILTLFVALIVLFLSLIISTFKGGTNLKEIVDLTFISASIAILIQVIMYPIIYKFGIEKGRIGIFVGIIIITLIVSLLKKVIDKVNIDLTSIANFLSSYYWVIIPIVLVGGLIISYKISEKIYLKKEF